MNITFRRASCAFVFRVERFRAAAEDVWGACLLTLLLITETLQQSFYEKTLRASVGKRAGTVTKEELKVVQNPLLQAMGASTRNEASLPYHRSPCAPSPGSRKFLVQLDDKKFKLDTDEATDSIPKLKARIAEASTRAPSSSARLTHACVRA